MKKFSKLLLFSFLIFVVISCSDDESIEPLSTKADDAYVPQVGPVNGRSSGENLTMGNPSGAVANSSTYWNYLITKYQFAMSYHRDRGTPNWVSWHLDNTWLGGAARQDDFRADTSLPSGWYRVGNTDYSGSGFDRGHNCPSADRTYSVSDNSATFFMTNMIPQAPTNNQQTWAKLETYCRTLVNQGNELYIIMGSYGTGGTGSNGYKTTIANGKVTVPNRVWKVILVLPQGSNDVSRVSSSTRVIAVDMPNSNSISTSWGTYRTTTDAIESKMGYNLFSSLPSSIQSAIESKVDNGPTQ